MTSASRGPAPTGDRLVLKIRTPAEICEAVPFLLGFQPRRSLVAVSLRGPRRRLGLTARVDLVDDRTLAGPVTDELVGHLVNDGAVAALVVAYAEEDEPDPEPYVQAMRDASGRAGLHVAEAILVRGGRWTSYTCREECCPPSGTPVRDRVASPGAVTAALVADGLQVRTDRAEVVSSVAPATGLIASAMRNRLHDELDRYVTAVVAPRRAERYRDETVALVRSSIQRMERGQPLAVDLSARLIVGLIDRRARDACLPAVIGVPAGEQDCCVGPGAIRLWTELTRRAVVAGSAAPVATILAASAYLDHGNGALANVALDRALADDPGYVLALYLRALLDHGVPPSTIRDWIVNAGRDAPSAGRADRPGRATS